MAEDRPQAAPAQARSTGPRWLVPVLSTVVTAAGLAAIWYLAVPRVTVCPAIYPAPPGCTLQDRVATATVWTVLVAIVWIATLVAVRLRRTVLPLVLLALSTALCLVGYWGTLYSAGSVIGLGGVTSTLGT